MLKTTYQPPKDWKDYKHLKENYLYLIAGSGRDSKHTRSKYIAFDTEAFRFPNNNKIFGEIGYSERQELFCFDFFDGEKHYYGKSHGDFSRQLKHLMEKYKKICLLIHNAQYDLSVAFPDGERLLDIFLGNPTKYKMRVEKDFLSTVTYAELATTNRTRRLTILDTTNFWKEKLATLAENYGQKIATEEDYHAEPEKWNAFLKEHSKDLVQKDTELLYNLWANFVEQLKNDDSIIGISSASSALKTFTHRYLEENIWLPKELAEPILKAYHGGMVDSYTLGDFPDNVSLDVNSLYPNVMKKYKYSIHPIEKVTKPTKKYIKQMESDIKEEKYNYFIQCKWQFPEDESRPILCMTNKKTKKLEFRLDGEGLITGREYEIAKQQDALIYDITTIYKFANADIFSKYVDHFYNKKKNAKNSSEKQTFKLFLNSLYGKFAQHLGHEKWVSYEHSIQGLGLKKAFDSGIHKGKINGKDVRLYPNFYAYNEDGEASYPCMIGCEITANARIFNYQIQKKLGINRVLNTDTDSFHIEAKNLHIAEEQGLIGDELGQLKIEERGREIISGLKRYKFLDAEGNVIIEKNKGVNGKKIGDNEYTSTIWHTKKSKQGTVTTEVIKKTLHPFLNPKRKYYRWESLRPNIYLSEPLGEGYIVFDEDPQLIELLERNGYFDIKGEFKFVDEVCTI